jgi:AraC-like DNA-binding protein
LLTALQRLLDLLAEPKDIAILAPGVRREITYRLLMSDLGARLRQVALSGSRGHQIAQAIDWLKSRYAEPLSVEKLAERVHMSPSAFHQHFRAMTAMSPLQYRKWLRLGEARRLMLAENMSAATAAFEVGYESPSQFSREYRRLFERPPLQDVAQLRLAAEARPRPRAGGAVSFRPPAA